MRTTIPALSFSNFSYRRLAGIAACAAVLTLSKTASAADASPILAKSSTNAPVAPRAIESLTPVRSGPWGELEISRIFIEAPDVLIASVQRPNSIPMWNFPGGTAESVRALMTRAGVAADVQERILDPKRTITRAGVLTAYPPVPDLEALPQSARNIIYPELAKSGLNEFHENPIYITAGKIEAWLHDTELSPKIRDLIRTMAWKSGSALAFSDIRTLMSEAGSDKEVQEIFKVATRVRTFMVRLKVGPNTDFKTLIDYWTNHGRSSDVLPILESLRECDAPAEMDISHLLPPIPRRRLYTYPTPDLAVRGRMPDCHWTSLNFFALTPQDQYLDLRLAANRVMEGYAQISLPGELGDVLVFLNPEGGAIHSCVYLADDLVYTKNGENGLSPWVIMRVGDLTDIYLRGPGYRAQYYRRKG